MGFSARDLFVFTALWIGGKTMDWCLVLLHFFSSVQSFKILFYRLVLLNETATCEMKETVTIWNGIEI